MLRILGNEEAIVDSASRLVSMYLFGSIGAPAAADMYVKEGTFWKEVSCARVMALRAVSTFSQMVGRT